MDKLIQNILSTKRAHNSKGELAFLGWLHGHIKSLGYEPIPMAEGCLTVDVLTPMLNGVSVPRSKTLFACHIDTMHSTAESDGTMQALLYDENFDHIFLANKKQDGCLGADDGVGIYILLKMIEAKVPGTYIFHRGEERGCIGARAMLLKHSMWLETFDRCIEFDRPGDNEVIVTQSGQSCASPAFGKLIVDAFAVHDLKYEVSFKGVLTDNRQYRQTIPECVNIGVGYSNQHSSDEYQDWGHLKKLTAACVLVNWDKMPVTRQIIDEEVTGYIGNWQYPGMRGYEPPAAGPNTIVYKGGKRKVSKLPQMPKLPQLPPPQIYKPKEKSLAMSFADEVELMNYEEILEACCDREPDELADAFSTLLIDLDAQRGRVARLEKLLGLSV